MSVEVALLLVLAAIAVVVVAHRLDERTGLPAAAVLPLIGIGYALLPGPNVELDPHLVLTVVLPPLLYSAALQSSLLELRRNVRTVASLSVLLVLVTAVAVGVLVGEFVAGASIAAGVALGAAVAPPDPVAALSVGRRVGLPQRLITLIEGEGLLNDATALTTLSVAVSAAVGGGFRAWSALGEFLLSAAGGVAVGLVVALAVRLVRRWLDDPLSLNAMSLAVPFLAYLAGEGAHVSGVLAVVVAGLVVGRPGSPSVSGASRLQVTAVWSLVDFLLEGLVFLLIGQQLPTVVRGLGTYSVGTVVIAAVITVGTVLLLRPLWLLATQALPRVRDRLSGREVVVLSWAGTRGVISLAAVFTLPLTTDSGAPFPARDLLLFCTFLVVLVTLVGQGVTFAPLVRALGLRADAADQARIRNQARAAAVTAGLSRLDDLVQHDAEADGDDGDGADTRAAVEVTRRQLEARLQRYRRRLDSLEGAEGDLPPNPRYETAMRVRRAVIDAEREELVRWRDAGRLPDAGLRELERELDREENLLPARPPV